MYPTIPQPLHEPLKPYLKPKVAFMGGDVSELTKDLRSPEVCTFRAQLNDAAKYAWILKRFLTAGGRLETL